MRAIAVRAVLHELGVSFASKLDHLSILFKGGFCLSDSSVHLLSIVLSRRYLANHETVYNQTWYGGASSCPGVPCENLGCYLQGQGHSESITYKGERFCFLHVAQMGLDCC